MVRAIEEEETTASGLLLPDLAKERPQKGMVIAVGDGKLDEDADKRIPIDIAEGDQVLYSKYRGTEIKVNGEELLVLRETDVLLSVSMSDEPQRRHRSNRQDLADIADLRNGVAEDIERLRELAR